MNERLRKEMTCGFISQYRELSGDEVVDGLRFESWLA